MSFGSSNGLFSSKEKEQASKKDKKTVNIFAGVDMEEQKRIF